MRTTARTAAFIPGKKKKNHIVIGYPIFFEYYKFPVSLKKKEGGRGEY